MIEISQAKFRCATVEESKSARGTFIWKIASLPWELTCKVMGSAVMLFSGGDVLSWQTPNLQKWAERISICLGYNLEKLSIESLYSFFGNRHFITNAALSKKLLSYQRNEAPFGKAHSFQMLLNIAREVFQDDVIEDSDFIFTCMPKMTEIYHQILSSKLKRKSIDNFKPLIKKKAEERLKIWEEKCSKGDLIDAAKELRLFTTGILLDLMFDAENAGSQITESIDFLNGYIIKAILGVTKEEKKQYLEVIQIFKNAVEEILDKEKIPLFESIQNFSKVQKKTLIFILFFAGQETTASLLAYALHYLALKPEKQIRMKQKLSKLDNEKEQKKIMDKLFSKCIKKFPPAYAIGRKLAKDSILEWRENGNPRSAFFPAGDILQAKIIDIAKKSESKNLTYKDFIPFGFGPHACPGRHLAIEEISQFLFVLISSYKITTQTLEKIKKIGKVTLQLKERVFIKIEKQDKHPS